MSFRKSGNSYFADNGEVSVQHIEAAGSSPGHIRVYNDSDMLIIYPEGAKALLGILKDLESQGKL